MAKEIILYNLRDDVSDEDYKKWLSLIHISEPTRPSKSSRMPASA